jgi:hypothetical protein
MSGTKAILIHGKDWQQIKDVPEQPFYNYELMTEGELSVSLVKRQNELYYSATGNPLFYDKAMRLGELLEFSETGKGKPQEKAGAWAMNTIKKTYPANTGAYIGGASLGQITFESWKEAEIKACNEIRKQWNDTPWIRFTQRAELRRKWEGCFDNVQYISTINDKFEQSGHHILYNFAEGAKPVPVQTKQVLHKIALENYSTVLGLSRENIRLWLRNGILSNNLKKGAGTLGAEETVNYLVRQVPLLKGNDPKIGLAPALLIPLLISIISAAAGVTVAILNRMNEADKIKMLSNTQGLGTQAFGPEETDFLSIGRAVETGALYPLLGIAAVLLLWE